MQRVFTWVSIVVGFVHLCSGACQAQEAAKSHFHFTGPMSASMLNGAAPARVTSGLTFTLILSDRGASISPDRFDLKGTGWSGSATLSFEGMKFADGVLKATVHLKNGSGNVIEGVRLDIVGATEEYRARDADGKEVLKTRSQTASLASPLLFGDMPTGQDADTTSLEVGGMAFKPETARISVQGVLSGLTYLGGFEVLKMRGAPEMGVDPQGRLYFVNTTGASVVRTEADGLGAVSVAKLPDQCLGVAVDSKTGDVYATATNNPAIFRFASTGELKGKIEAKDGLRGWTHNLRVSPDGTLYSDMSGAIVQIVNGKAGTVLSQVAGERIGARLFNIDAGGNLWLCTSTSLFMSDIAGKNGRRIATGPDWHLGSVTSPNGCRIDSAGQVYVTEGEDRKEAGRISVFDKNGRLVRVFGRGNSAPLVGKVHPGQVFRPTDIAFGKDGLVYILQTGDPGSKNPVVLMLQPF